MKLLKLCLKIAISLMVLFLLVEIVYRIVHKDTTIEHPPIYQIDSVLSYKYLANTTFTKGGKEMHINKYGYIGKDWPITKPDNFFRIAIIGACSVAGGMHIKGHYSSFPLMLQNKFQQNGYNVEILNFGVGGANRSYSLYKSIEKDVVQFKPDMILFEFSGVFSDDKIVKEVYRNNIIEYPYGNTKAKEHVKKLVDEFYPYLFLRKIVKNVETVRALVRYYGEFNTNKLGEYCKFIVEDKVSVYGPKILFTKKKAAQLLVEENDKLKNDSIKLCLFIFRCTNASSYKSIPILPICGNFDETTHYPKDEHYNYKGTLLLTDIFYDQLIKIIPPKYYHYEPKK